MKKIISYILNLIFKFIKVNNDMILFETGRDMVDGSPKAIYMHLKEKYPNNYKTKWLVTKKTDISGIDKNDYAYYKTIKSLYYLAKSKYWIRSESIGNILKKKKNQIYIQAWHGHGAMKKMGYDINNDTDRPPIEHVKEWDYFIASDELDEKVIISSTGYNGKSVMLGAPCTDEIIKINNDDAKKQIIKSKLGINKNKKVIFYAPTFRESDLINTNIKLPILSLAQLQDYVILVRLHPLTKNNIDNSIFENKNIINACLYPDASEILAITDILISDYSSIIYEFSILNKPIIFYNYDLESYLKERGLYLDPYTELPGMSAYNEEDLVKLICNIKNDINKYNEKLKTFNDKFNRLNDGHVCERFVKKMQEGGFINE